MDVLFLRNPAAGRIDQVPVIPARRETLLLDATADLSRCAGRDLLVLEGGDGTLHRLLSRLFLLLEPAAIPPIAVLPAGTTNMSCADWNSSRQLGPTVASLNAQLAAGKLTIVERPVLSVQCGDCVHYGCFYGLGLIPEAIARFHAGRSERVVVSTLQMAMTFARSLLRTDTMQTVCVDGRERATFAMMATSLDRLLYGMRPYVTDGQPRRLHTTWIFPEAGALWRHLRKLARGAPELFARPGFETRDVRSLTLDFAGWYTIDGELYATGGQQSGISLSPPLRWVVL
ncbi:MAG: hypothetical protein H6993_01245 [Pseudomonadales bacterium]|nr:hypothetical protein [Pseudomonadales bacterium]MCP5182550.1 hypothetical protein [Pseudomonadales bacterium]